MKVGIEVTDELIESFWSHIEDNAKELNQLGFDVQVGGDERGEAGMIEVTISKRERILPKFSVLTFFGVGMR